MMDETIDGVASPLRYDIGYNVALLIGLMKSHYALNRDVEWFVPRFLH